MRIALFTDTYIPDINGVARTYQRLTAYLKNNGVDVKIFAPAGGKDTGVEYNITRFFGWDFFLYPECKLSFPNYFKIHRELEEFKPDLIHIATPFVLGLAGLKYAKSHGVPTVAVFHTNFPQYLQYYRIPWLKKAAWQFLRGSIPKWIKLFALLLKRKNSSTAMDPQSWHLAAGSGAATV